MGETTQEVKSDLTSLFSPEERRNVVLSFIDAYIRGTVRVNFWEDGRKILDGTTGREYTKADKVGARNDFNSMVGIACGSEQAKLTPKQFEDVIDALFRRIIIFRSGGFIEGSFLYSHDILKRVEAMEQRIGSVEKLLEELRIILKVGHDP